MMTFQAFSAAIQTRTINHQRDPIYYPQVARFF